MSEAERKALYTGTKHTTVMPLENVCDALQRKKPYDTKQQAQSDAGHLAKKFEKPMRVYRCHECRKYHLTKQELR